MILKKLFFKYQTVLWLVAQAKAEYQKVGGFVPETIAVVTLLSVRGVQIPFWQIPVYFIGLLILAALIGKFLVVVGVTKFNTSMANKQNEELLELLERVKNIESKLK